MSVSPHKNEEVQKMLSDDEKVLWRLGCKAGVWLFAVNKDGEQLVGITEEKIQDVYLQIDEGKYDHLMEE